MYCVQVALPAVMQHKLHLDYKAVQVMLLELVLLISVQKAADRVCANGVPVYQDLAAIPDGAWSFRADQVASSQQVIIAAQNPVLVGTFVGTP